MVKRLNALGVRPHNNIVDITNYVMMLTGQPLHAFDLDTFAERDGHRRVVVRAAQQDEKFTTLDGEERVLDAGMGLITDGERPVALAGVMGGMDSEIEDDTVDVMVESACFNAGRTSHTSRDLSLISDASIRFERQGRRDRLRGRRQRHVRAHRGDRRRRGRSRLHRRVPRAQDHRQH